MPFTAGEPADLAMSPGQKAERLTQWDVELVRILIQSLRSMGYSQSATSLEEESGVLLESNDVATFRQNVLGGQWGRVLESLEDMHIANRDRLSDVRFLVLKQKFLEQLEERQLPDALETLRLELTPIPGHENEIHQLSAYLMCQDAHDLRHRAAWDGASGQSRAKLLKALQVHFPPALMVPENRLDTLLKQAVSYQQSTCTYHNTDEQQVSLLADHKCDRALFPNQTLKVLRDHTDEIWYVRFSYNGQYLASASKDSTVCLWDVSAGEVCIVLTGHKGPVSFVAFSPDDRMILSCSNDKTAKIWSVEDGTCIRTIRDHSQSVTAGGWCPDGKRFVTAGLDTKTHLWSLEEQEPLRMWEGARFSDIDITADGHWLVGICYDKNIRMYSIDSNAEHSIQESDSITSLSLSRDSKYALVNISSQEIHMWDLASRCLVRKFYGQKQGKFVIRSCFGGLNDSFVVSGSEDFRVYIWHRDKGELLEVLEGHDGTVNSVSFNPRDPYMFASGSDDRSIRIWGLGSEKGAAKAHKTLEK